MRIGFTRIGREVASLLRCFIDGIRHSDTCPLVLRQGPHVQDKIRSCISQKGVLRAEQSKNNNLQSTSFPGLVNTRVPAPRVGVLEG